MEINGTKVVNKIFDENKISDELQYCVVLQVAALGVFGYATFSIIAGCLGDYRKPPNLVVMVTGIISIVQVTRVNTVTWPTVNVIMNTITVVSVSLDGGNNVILPASIGSCCQLHLDTLVYE